MFTTKQLEANDHKKCDLIETTRKFINGQQVAYDHNFFLSTEQIEPYDHKKYLRLDSDQLITTRFITAVQQVSTDHKKYFKSLDIK